MSLGQALIDGFYKDAWLMTALKAAPAVISAVSAVKDVTSGGTTPAGTPKPKIDTGAPAVPAAVSSNSSVTA